MKLDRTRWTYIFLALGLVLSAWWVVRRDFGGEPVWMVRFATFNTSLFRATPKALLEELEQGDSSHAKVVAEIVQRMRPDVLLLNEFDRDVEGRALDVFAKRYLAEGQNGAAPIDYPYRYFGEVNTGEPTGVDLDRDGRTDGPGDAFGYGRFPGQYGMALLSRYPIVNGQIRTFRTLRWRDVPDGQLPDGYFGDAALQVLRLSSKSHWDVPVQVTEQGRIIHVLCSHPTPPVFDGEEDRNGRRNHDEIRLWADYVTPGEGQWIVDDAGQAGGLPTDAEFVILGDLNADPMDGDGRPGAVSQLLDNPRVQDPQPRSEGAPEAAREQWGRNSVHRGDAALDTGDFADDPDTGPGNLRLDYVLPSRSLQVVSAGVFWPPADDPQAALLAVSDHRMVWVDVQVN